MHRCWIAKKLHRRSSATVWRLKADEGCSIVHIGFARRVRNAIARILGVSTHAVSWHARQIYARLDVHNAAQLGQKLLAH